MTDNKNRNSKKRFAKIITFFANMLGFLTFCFCLVLLWNLFDSDLPKRLSYRESIVVSYNDGQSAHVFLSEDDKWRIRASLDSVDPNYVDALLKFEDKRFYQHFGVDPVAISRAIFLNITSGRRVSGASTITMQLIRVLEPRPRNYRSKIIEAYRATQLELKLSKREILEGYMRYVPFGRNVEGIEAASLAYFGHSAKDLSAEEIATLLAVPQNPNKRYPRKSNLKRLRNARDRIADRLLKDGLFLEDVKKSNKGNHVTNEERAKTIHKRVIASDPPKKLKPFPRELPHLAFWLRKKESETLFFPTTIDRGIQKSAERILASHHESAKERGIQNASIVVVDNRSKEIKALVGNFTFDNTPTSQIPGFAVQRSPGSLLKPFIVASAIDSGLVLPEMLTLDIPSHYGKYSPKNYDQNFHGLVRVEEALSKSFNIPFVRMLNQTGVGSFIGMLRDLGVKNLRDDPGYYGLSAAIGSVETSPLEIAAMYSTLNGDGKSRDLQLLKNKPLEEKGLTVMSPGSAWLVRRILRTNDRPGFNRRNMNPNATPIFWKTGTSYGFRDAWAAGSSLNYTAVVWMGNLDNSGNAALLGSRRSGPVLFDILQNLGQDRDEDPRPDDLVEIKVCAYSGHPPTDACPHTRRAFAPERHVPTVKCPYHLKVDIEEKSGRALAPSCRAGRNYKTKSFLSWPASVRRYLTDRHRFAPKIPMLADDCRPTESSRPPRILSPLSQTLRLIAGVDPSEQELPLEAETDISGVKLSWFVDGAFVGSGTSEARLWWTPKKGKHEFLVMDDAGQASRMIVKVR